MYAYAYESCPRLVWTACLSNTGCVYLGLVGKKRREIEGKGVDIKTRSKKLGKIGKAKDGIFTLQAGCTDHILSAYPYTQRCTMVG